MKITHEFPNVFYQNGFAKSYTDYDYCLIHRYLDTPSYKDYFLKAVKEGRTVYLDNSLYELGKTYNPNKYIEVIKELNPTYYMLPDVFNEGKINTDSQLDFYINNKGLPSIPIGIIHGKTTDEMINAFDILNETLPEESLIAIPFGSAAWLNPSIIGEKYFENEDIKYIPLMMATNRNNFMGKYFKKFNTCGRKLHMLGCKSTRELNLGVLTTNSSFINKSTKYYNNIPFTTLHYNDIPFINSIDTSLPVAMGLEGYSYDNDYISIPIEGSEGIYINPMAYKPRLKIDNVFNRNWDQITDRTILNLVAYNIVQFKIISKSNDYNKN